jgi:hypothetical protein
VTTETSAPVANTPSTDTSTASPTTVATTPAPAADTPVAPAAVVPAEAPPTPEAPKPEAPKAPEKYDFKTLEGQVDQAVLTKFEGLAREMGMSQDQATKMMSQLAPEVEAAQKANMASAVGKWVDAAKTDKEFGGDKLNENLAIAKTALEKFGTPALSKLLNDSGLGNHPEIIRAFVRAGKQITPGSFVSSGQGASPTASAGSKLYPSMKS